jgi:hypothetical protein
MPVRGKEGRMNLVHGIHHKRSLEDILISVMQGAIVTLILFIVALVAADAWIKEDIARVEKLKQHLYEVAYARATVGPAAPTGVRPNYGEPSEPKVRLFQDVGRSVTSGMGYDARKRERGNSFK